MWKHIRKKISNFIFEELEEELEVEAEYVQERQHTEKDVQPIRAKVAYQYPENEEAKFRFPVIPDKANERERNVRNEKKFENTIKKERVRRSVTGEEKSAERPRRKGRHKPVPFEAHEGVEPLILGYKRRKKVDEMEEVPAYVRRNRKKRREEQRLEEKQRLQRRNELEKKVGSTVRHTTPDELDEVFRKRDQKDGRQVSITRTDVHERSPHTGEMGRMNKSPKVEKKTDEREERSMYSDNSRSNVPFVHPERTSDKKRKSRAQSRAERRTRARELDRKRTDSGLRAEQVESSSERTTKQWNDDVDHRERTRMKRETKRQRNYFLDQERANDTILEKQKTDEASSTRRMLTTEQMGNDHVEQVAATNTSHQKMTEETYAVPDELLNDPRVDHNRDEQWLEEQRKLLEQTLTYFHIDATVVHVTQGPAVTRFEIQPDLGVKVSRIRNLADDFKLNMAAKDIRIEAPIPGKNTVGIEVPNRTPQVVTLQEIIETDAFKEASSPLAVALGVTIEGEPLVTNIDSMPHGLIAGATGSGKSVCINSILLSLLYKATPDEVKLMLIDPKMVELTPYNGIPHLLSPVITDPQAATKALKWAVDEMERRYELFVATGVRNIVKYNEKVDDNRLSYIVIVIDELADLMLVSPQEVEDAICRIAQKARACGIHLLLATQRPSVDVITGLIKANIPTRIAFSVSSQVDSRTIVDTNGAEKLLGKGDMLFVPNGTNKRLRLQGPFVSDDEVDRVVSYVRSTGEPNYVFEEEQLLLEVDAEEEDELLLDAIYFVIEQGSASTSMLQRQFRIGYNRAARLIDTLYKMGVVSGQNGTKPRDVLITEADLEDIL
ncbi:MAG TPA: DNA translocase FtsK [Pseudogracilibacillus sp.]|nr:DNA translocase FtsK [Pseudogracilibacillus sp.]